MKTNKCKLISQMWKSPNVKVSRGVSNKVTQSTWKGSTGHYHSPPAEPGRGPIALAGLCRDADIGRDLVDMALEGLSCLDAPAAEPGLTISTKITI